MRIIDMHLDDFLDSIEERISQTTRKLLDEIPKEERFLTRKETAQRLGVCISTLRNLEQRRILVPRRVGRSIRYSTIEVDSAIKEGFKYKRGGC